MEGASESVRAVKPAITTEVSKQTVPDRLSRDYRLNLARNLDGLNHIGIDHAGVYATTGKVGVFSSKNHGVGR